MTRFVADTLDLSRLPAPTLVNVDYEAIRTARLASLEGRLTATGIEYNVAALETDPAVILQEEDAYRQALDLAAINDATKAVLLPYALGSDLDNLGSLFGCARLADEGDGPYRQRIALAPEAYATAGSIGAYVYHARAVDAAVRDVGVTCPAPGVARVVVLGSADGGATSAALVSAVQQRLNADEIRPLTDQIVVLGAEIAAYAIRLRLVIPPGPDPSIVKAAALAGLTQLAADRYKVGAGVDVSAIVGAAYGPNIRRIVVAEPMADLAPSPLAAPWCAGIEIVTDVADV